MARRPTFFPGPLVSFFSRRQPSTRNRPSSTVWPSCPSLSLLSACSALEGPLRVSRTTSPGPLGLQRPPRTVPFSFTAPRGPHVSASPSLPFSFACFPFLAPSMALLRWQVASPPRHLESTRMVGNRHAPLPLLCTPQPPAYKAPDRAPPFSPFPLLASSNSPPPAISLTRASIHDADAPVTFAMFPRSISHRRRRTAPSRPSWTPRSPPDDSR